LQRSDGQARRRPTSHCGDRSRGWFRSCCRTSQTIATTARAMIARINMTHSTESPLVMPPSIMSCSPISTPSTPIVCSIHGSNVERQHGDVLVCRALRYPSMAPMAESTTLRQTSLHGVGSDRLILEGAVCAVGVRFQLGPVDLVLGEGSVCVVEGTNGAGKTTLLRVAAGLLPLSVGRRWCPAPAMYLRSGAGARDGQRVSDAVTTVAALAGRSAAAARAATVTVGLDRCTNWRVGSLSAGERARLTLAVALVAAPDLLCLDEPFAHVDAEGADLVKAVIRQLAATGCAVMVACPRWNPFGDGDRRLLLADGRVRVA
jgi:ABC-type transport system involved in cytochrome c biogenesis ATPase subunit